MEPKTGITAITIEPVLRDYRVHWQVTLRTPERGTIVEAPTPNEALAAAISGYEITVK